jgi:hypothetical protein
MMLRTLQRKERDQWDEFARWLPGKPADDIRERWFVLEDSDRRAAEQRAGERSRQRALEFRAALQRDSEQRAEEWRAAEAARQRALEQRAAEGRAALQRAIDLDKARRAAEQNGDRRGESGAKESGDRRKRTQAEEGGRNAPGHVWLKWIGMAILPVLCMAVAACLA